MSPKKLFGCSFDDCQYKSSSVWNLKRHRKIHDKPTNFPAYCPTHRCEACNRVFGSANLLRHHKLRSHTGHDDEVIEISDIECPRCFSFFQTPMKLTRHFKEAHDNSLQIVAQPFESIAIFKYFMRLQCNLTGTTLVKIKSVDSSLSYRCIFSNNATAQSSDSNAHNTQCTAFVFGKINSNGSVSANYCFDHSHSFDPSLLRLHGSISEEKIIQYIQLGLDTQKIKQLLHEPFLLEEAPRCHDFFITEEDIEQVKARNNITDDMQDEFALLSCLLQSQEEGTAIRYTPPVNPQMPLGFVLAFMTNTQRKWLQEYGFHGIAIHHMSVPQKFPLKLTTVLVPGADGAVLPVAHLLSTQLHIADVRTLFELIKTETPRFNPAFLICDDNNVFVSAFYYAFPNAKTNFLLCKSHMLRKLSDAAINNSHKSKIMAKLSSLFVIQESEQFMAELESLERFLYNVHENAFLTYFRKNVLPKLETWILIKDAEPPFAAKICAELWQRDALLEKTRHRLDLLVQALTEYPEQYCAHLAVTNLRFCCPAKQQSENARRHSQAEKESDVTEIIHQNLSYWITIAGNELKYEIFHYQKCRCPNANWHCSSCFACPYEFSCSCALNLVSGCSCKHIHMLQMYLTKNECDSTDAPMLKLEKQCSPLVTSPQLSSSNASVTRENGRPEDADKNTTCCYCFSKHANGDKRRRHITRYHSQKKLSVGNQLSCPTCSENQQEQIVLATHYQTVHDKSFKVEKCTVKDRESLDQWIDELEKISTCSFFQAKSDGQECLFQCLFTSRAYPGTTCTAFINASQQPDGSLALVYCRSHSHKMAYSFLCCPEQLCIYEAKFYADLRLHAKEEHGIVLSSVPEAVKQVMVCEACGARFMQRQALRRHMQESHFDLCGPRVAHSTPRCPKCNECMPTQEALTLHYREAHDKSIQIKSAIFQNMEIFVHWRKVMEYELGFSMVRIVAQSAVFNFRCNAVFQQQSPQPHTDATHPQSCIAFIKAKTLANERIHITYCFDHSHPKDPKLPSLCGSIVEEKIVDLMELGLEGRQIIEKLRAPFLGQNVAHRQEFYLSLTDVKLVRDRYRRSKCHLEEAESLENLIEARRNTGIIHFEPSTSEHGFVLCIMTPTQKSWLTAFGNLGIILDHTSDVTSGHLKLTTLLVLDKEDNVRPVLFFLSANPSVENIQIDFRYIKNEFPNFRPNFMLTTDDCVFWEAYVKEFPCSGTRKILNSTQLLEQFKKKSRNFQNKACSRKALDQLTRAFKATNFDVFASEMVSVQLHLQRNNAAEFAELIKSTIPSLEKQFGMNLICKSVETYHESLKSTVINEKSGRIDHFLRRLLLFPVKYATEFLISQHKILNSVNYENNARNVLQKPIKTKALTIPLLSPSAIVADLANDVSVNNYQDDVFDYYATTAMSDDESASNIQVQSTSRLDVTKVVPPLSSATTPRPSKSQKDVVVNNINKLLEEVLDVQMHNPNILHQINVNVQAARQILNDHQM